jgi:hypothetical protein
MVAGTTPGDHEMSQPAANRPRPEDWAAVLFAKLDVAQATGNYAVAAEVQQQLRELGWVVARRRPRHEAIGREVANA